MNKKQQIFLGVIVLFTLLFSFKSKDKGEKYTDYSLKNNEIRYFGDKNGFVKGRTVSSRGAYDGSQYRWELVDDVLEIKYVGPADGPHQNELDLSKLYGDIRRSGDTVSISATSIFDKVYLFDVEREYTVDSFEKSIDIIFEMKPMSEKKCRTVISNHGSSFRLILVPEKVRMKTVYKANHDLKTIGVFSFLEISDNNKTKKYGAGD
ncbi:MAG: hypothetical protein ACPGTP_08720, partial [Bacteroidia bacterium]